MSYSSHHGRGVSCVVSASLLGNFVNTVVITARKQPEFTTVATNSFENISEGTLLLNNGNQKTGKIYIRWLGLSGFSSVYSSLVRILQNVLNKSRREWNLT